MRGKISYAQISDKPPATFLLSQFFFSCSKANAAKMTDNMLDAQLDPATGEPSA
uniref:Uncharacterized protein n=1 Tax=Phakopsora pachyrhizi TaxID=170000 RepID=A0A0S1MJV7_PHAPC